MPQDSYAGGLAKYLAERLPGEDDKAYAARIAAMRQLRMSPVRDPDERDIITLQNKAANDPALQKGSSYIDIQQGGRKTRAYQMPSTKR